MQTRQRKAVVLAVFGIAASGALSGVASAQSRWVGGGGDTSWNTAANWDALPAFTSSDVLHISNSTVGAPFSGVASTFTSGTSFTMGGSKAASKIAFGAGSTALTLGTSSDTLTLTGTSSGSAGVGTAVWLATTSDNIAATVNANLLFDRGSAGSYTAYLRENGNSSGGTTFNGTITQGAGQSVTLSFSQGSARGEFRLNNASNSIAGIANTGTTLRSMTPGSFGGAALTLSGGLTGAATNEHWTGSSAIANSIAVTGNSTIRNDVSARLTGALVQNAAVSLSYSGGTNAVTRVEYSATTFNASATTQIGGGGASSGITVAPSSMAMFAPGTLSIGTGSSSTPSGVIALTGLSSGGDVPTWSDFSSARTYQQTGGSGTWRMNIAAGNDDNVSVFGGFAARGADLVIPASFPFTSSTGATSIDQIFTRNFQLGSSAVVGGTPYADRAVRLETPINYGSQAAGTERFFSLAGNYGVTRSTTAWTLGGAVHELAGAITGDNINLYALSIGFASATNGNPGPGIVRISNPANSLTGASRIILGAGRTSVTLQDGFVSALAQMGDNTSAVAIFTSDSAFGGAYVEVASRNSISSSNTSGLLLLEDANGSGSTTFNKSFTVVNTSIIATSGYGSYAGDVVYSGTVTHAGNQSNTIVHVQSGTMTLNGATLTNNRSADNILNKGGAGTLVVADATYNGSNASNQWQVRSGTLLYNDTSNDSFTDFDVFAGATLGGSGAFTVSGTSTINMAGTLAPGNSAGTLDIAVTSLDFASASSYLVELGGTSPGDGTGFYDQTNISGRIALSGTVSLGVTLIDGYAPVAGDTFYILTRGATGALTSSGAGTLGSGSGLFAGLIEGASFYLGGQEFKITYEADWTGTQLGSSLIGGNDVALTVVPEPTTLATLGLIGGLVLSRRRSC